MIYDNIFLVALDYNNTLYIDILIINKHNNAF